MNLIRTGIGILVALMVIFLPLASSPAKDTGLAAPAIDIPKPSYDWGEVPKGEVVTHPFTVLNTGTAPLEISKVQSD